MSPAHNPITGYFRTVWQILTRPSQFFRSLPPEGGVAWPLAFALITHWLGESISFAWRLLIGGALSEHFARLFQMAGDVAEVDSPGRHAYLMEIGERVQHWLWGAGSVIVDPFLTLLRILFISFIVWVGARILVSPGVVPGREGAPREITYETALRVICYGLAPSILSALPLLGGLVSALYVVAVTVIAAREVYRIGTGRAIVVAMFPQFLLMAFALLIMAAMFTLLFKMVASTF